MNINGNPTNPWSIQQQEFEKPHIVNVWDALPSVTIDISNEMGGTFIKHVNYIVTVDDQSVSRRYSDFDYLNSQLLKRYPSRLFLPLPPKKFSGNKESDFLLLRKQGLLRHPIINNDALFAQFLTAPVFAKQDALPSIDNDALTKQVLPPVHSIFNKYAINPPEDLHVIDLGWLFEWESLVDAVPTVKQSLSNRRSEFLLKLEQVTMTYHRLSVLADKLQLLHHGAEMQEIINKISNLVEEKQDFIHLSSTKFDNSTDVVELHSVSHTPINTPINTPELSQSSSKKEIKLYSHESDQVLLNRDSWLSHFKTLGTKLYLITDHHSQNHLIYAEFVEALRIRRDMLMHFQELIRKQQSKFRMICNLKSILLKKMNESINVDTSTHYVDDVAMRGLEFELELIQHIVESEYRLLLEYTGYMTFIFQHFIQKMVNYQKQTYLMWNDLNNNMSEWPSDHLI